MDYDDFEQEKWQLNIHEMVTDLHCSVVTLMLILQQKDMLSLDEFKKVKDIVKTSDKYTPIFQSIDEQRDLIKQYESGERDLVDDLFADLFNRGDAT